MHTTQTVYVRDARRRPKQQTIEHHRNRAVETDAQREQHDREEGGTSCLGQTANGVSQVLRHPICDGGHRGSGS
jgi:hypothetical protein